MTETTNGNNGGGAPAAGQADTAAGGNPTLNVLAQYVKDFSFENPNVPQTLAGSAKNPSIAININVNARGMSATDYEVSINLEAKATDGETTVFNVEIDYAGIFRIQNVPQENLQAVVLIECPRMLFPFARQIIADATRNGGYPPLMVDPIDFAALFRQRLADQQKAAAASPAKN